MMVATFSIWISLALAALALAASDCPDEASLLSLRTPRTSLEASVAESMKLSRTFEDIASTLPAGPTQELFTRLRVCTSCSKYERLGEADDGGYLTCMDGLGEGQCQAAYSMGVEHHDQWSMDIYNLLKAPIYQFDCTVDGPAQNCADCHFHKYCLQGASGAGGHPEGPNMNMEQVLNATGQTWASSDSLIMKMDIEGAEWPIFADEHTGLSKFKQLIVEFHWLDDEASHALYATALRNIENAGLLVSHLHGNNFAGMYEKDGMQVPSVLEVTFIKGNPKLAQCQTQQQLHPLDSPNNPVTEELPMANLR